MSVLNRHYIILLRHFKYFLIKTYKSKGEIMFWRPDLYKAVYCSNKPIPPNAVFGITIYLWFLSLTLYDLTYIVLQNVLTTTALLMLLTITNGYKILFMVPFNAPSHWILLQHFVKELIERGHEVTAIVNSPISNFQSPNYTEILIDPPFIEGATRE